MILKRSLWALLCLLLLPTLASAQQTGVVTGKITGTDGLVIPGVTVEARSEALPGPRVTVSDGRGAYRFQTLPPGICNITFELSGMAKVTKEVLVQLNQDTVVDVTMSVAGVTETVTVAATIVPVIERESAAIKSGVSSETIRSLPVGQDYRDLLKLVPGVQYTQDSIRGQSAGGSGQDNVYKFDGVNVTLPLYGTLSTEPASYDIAQVTTLKGGARAVDFERSAGFTVDTVSKSGTNRFGGQVSYQFQSASMASSVKAGTLSTYDQNLDWFTAGVGGPLWTNRLFFYGSVLPARAQPSECRQRLRQPAGLHEQARRRVPQAHLPADLSDRGERELSLLAPPGHGVPLLPDVRAVDRPRQRVVAAARHSGRFVDHQQSQFRVVQVDAFRKPRLHAPRQRFERDD